MALDASTECREELAEAVVSESQQQQQQKENNKYDTDPSEAPPKNEGKKRKTVTKAQAKNRQS